MVVSISSLVVVLSALLYPGRRVATSSPPSPPFPLGWLGLFPGPKVAKLPQPPHFIFHPFHKSSCCHHGAKSFCSLHKSLSPFPQIILLQTSSSTARLRYATLGSPPPLGRPSTERPLCVSVSLPIPPLSSLLPWRTGGFLSGWVEALLGATLHGDCFISNQELISLTCDQTELSVANKLLTGQLLDHHSSISPGDM